MIKKILVSQPEPASEKSIYHDIAQHLGVEFTFRPFVKVEGLEAKEFRAQKINILDYSAIVFNSRNAIEHFFRLCKELRVTPPEEMKYFGISEKVILYIQKFVQYRKRKVFFGSSGRWPELITTMAKHKAENYLIPLSEGVPLESAAQLDAKKLKHTECAMFRTVETKFEADAYKGFDMILIFTPTGVHSLMNNFPNFEQGDIRLGCFGDATAKAIEEAGLRVDLKVSGTKRTSVACFFVSRRSSFLRHANFSFSPPLHLRQTRTSLFGTRHPSAVLFAAKIDDRLPPTPTHARGATQRQRPARQSLDFGLKAPFQTRRRPQSRQTPSSRSLSPAEAPTPRTHSRAQCSASRLHLAV